MRRRCDRSFGLGPLFFHPDEGGGGTGGSGGGGPAPTPDPAPKPGDPPPEPPKPDPKTEPSDRAGMVPRERFDEVNDELRKLRKAEEDRKTAELTAQGEHEKVAEQEKTKREAAEARALTIARRSAFIGAAAGNVADPEAAYKLATADGLLNDLAVDDDGNAKDPKAPGKIVEEVVKRYEFLKPKEGDRSFGGDRNGAGNGPPIDPSKMTGREMLSAGYAQSSGRTRGSS